MAKTKSIYLTFSLLMAFLLAVGASYTRALAEEFEGWDASPQPANPSVSMPTLDGQNTGFALETPAEAGAQPITSPYVMPLPRPVAPFPIQLNRYVRRYLSDFANSPYHLQDTFDQSHPYMADMVKVQFRYGAALRATYRQLCG
jgi:hypothetical protein